MIQRMFVTLDTKKTNYKNVGKINHGDDLILELTVLSDGDMISFNDPMVDLLVKKSDGKMIRQNSGIEHIKPNKFIIEVSKDCVTSPGLATNQLIINDNGRISTCMFYYTILNSLEEDIIESISNVEVLEQLDEFTIQMKDKMENFDEELQNRMSELEDAIDDLAEFFGDTSVDLLEAELNRNEAEQSRAQAESVRVQNESRRLQNDLDLANAEAERVRAENVRIQNEVDRALADAVMDQKESEREDSELERIQNESKRTTDEAVRQQNESTRQSNESIRMSNENDRKTQENRRVTAETNRVNAETTRRNNENSRISNETERQKTIAEMKSLIGNVNDFDERIGVVEDEIEEINSSLDKKVQNGINVVYLSRLLGMNIESDFTYILQYALDNYGDVFIPNGIYYIKDTINIKCRNAKGIKIEGESCNNTVLQFDNNINDKHMFNIEVVTSWGGSRYKYISNLNIQAKNGINQSIFRYEDTQSTATDFGDSGLQIEKCNIYTTGYVLDFRGCPWVGNSYLKDCEIQGNGIAFIYPKHKRGGAYNHATSNLLIESVHFSGIMDRRGAVLDLTGCQNTVVRNVTLEGYIYSLKDTSDSIGDGFVGAEAYSNGLFFNLIDSSVDFDNCWFETGGTDNSPNALAGLITSQVPSASNPNLPVLFKGCGYYQFNKKIKIGNGSNLGSVVNVIFNNYFSYNTFQSDSPFIVNKGGLLTIENLGTVMPLAKINHPRIRIKNKFALNMTSSNTTVGDGFLTSNYDKKIIYQYTGGYIDNINNNLVTVNGKYINSTGFYPHHSKYGNTLLLTPDNYDFRFGNGKYYIDGTKHITALFIYRIIHGSNHNTIKTFNYTREYSNEWITLEFGDLYQLGTLIPSKNTCKFVELINVMYFEGNGDITLNHNIQPIKCYQTVDVYGNIYKSQINMEGTWYRNDVVIKSDSVSKRVFTSNGTSRTILINGGITKISNNTISIANLEDFEKLVDGDYIKITTNIGSSNFVVQDLIYSNSNYIVKLDKNFGETVTEITMIENLQPTYKDI